MPTLTDPLTLITRSQAGDIAIKAKKTAEAGVAEIGEAKHSAVPNAIVFMPSAFPLPSTTIKEQGFRKLANLLFLVNRAGAGAEDAGRAARHGDGALPGGGRRTGGTMQGCL